MATKSRRPAPPSAAARFSPATRIVAGLLAFMMVGSLIFVVVAGSGGGSSAPAPALPIPEDCPAPDGSGTPRLAFDSRPTWCLRSGVTYTAVFYTTEGEIRVALDISRTPETVNNFVVLTRYGYYDETLLFRFDPTIAIIQGGAPTTNSWSDPGPGYTIPDEGGEFIQLSNGGLRGPFSYRAGDLVMARSAGPDSSGAQFFFATGPEVSLLDNQGTYLVFGHADEAGIAVLQAMMDLYELDDTSPYGGGPIRDVVVRSITIELG
jgi:cyclophilin family peptidyl-prolyl cis-trans isomerase